MKRKKGQSVCFPKNKENPCIVNGASKKKGNKLEAFAKEPSLNIESTFLIPFSSILITNSRGILSITSLKLTKTQPHQGNISGSSCIHHKSKLVKNMTLAYQVPPSCMRGERRKFASTTNFSCRVKITTQTVQSHPSHHPKSLMQARSVCWEHYWLE